MSVSDSAQLIADVLAPAPPSTRCGWRWGTVEQVNSDGSMHVRVGGSVLPSVRALASAMTAQVGDRVRVDYLGTDAVVVGVRATGGIRIPTTAPVTLEGRSVMYIEGAKGNVAVYAPKLATGSNQWNPILGIQTKGGGVWTLGNYDGESFKFCYHSQSTITAGTNAPDRTIQFNADGTASGFVASDMLPTVLYNNTTGTNGNVTLSQSAANFTRLRIFANLQNAGYCSCEVWSPNGKSFSVTGMALPQSTTIQQAWWSGSISGTTITKKSSGYINTTTHSSGNHTGAAATSTDMRIVRVEGYKW